MCLLCEYSSKRGNLKVHLTKANKNGTLKCPGLRVVIPSDVWANEIMPHYTKDRPLPDLSRYANKIRKLTPLKKLSKLRK